MTRDEAISTATTRGAEVIDMEIGNLIYAASDDIEVMAWLLNIGLIEEIRKGGTIKYNGVLVYEH